MGIKNKSTLTMRQWIQQLIDDNRELLESDLKMLEPVQRWNIVEKLIQYNLPKMRNDDVTLTMQRLSDADIDLIVDKLMSDE